MPTASPYQLTERQLVVRFLRQRADFWARFAIHKMTARVLRTEADLIEAGHHNKSGLAPVDEQPTA